MLSYQLLNALKVINGTKGPEKSLKCSHTSTTWTRKLKLLQIFPPIGTTICESFSFLAYVVEVWEHFKDSGSLVFRYPPFNVIFKLFNLVTLQWLWQTNKKQEHICFPSTPVYTDPFLARSPGTCCLPLLSSLPIYSSGFWEGSRPSVCIDLHPTKSSKMIFSKIVSNAA